MGHGSLGCSGNAEVKTPHIDRLADGGMRFTDFHSNGALCSPTRAALLTGLYQQRKEVIGVLDESVGAVVAELRKHQLEANTLVIFCSDNGPAAPGGFAATAGLRGKKGTLFEGGHRVPFIASWPGAIPAAATSDEPLMAMDLLPTFAKLAGATLPPDRVFDGKDIAPIFKGERSNVERDLHWQSGTAWAIRRGPWKLTGAGRKPTTLVNLQQDRSEAENLLSREPERTAELLKAHQQWLKFPGEK